MDQRGAAIYFSKLSAAASGEKVRSSLRALQHCVIKASMRANLFVYLIEILFFFFGR